MIVESFESEVAGNGFVACMFDGATNKTTSWIEDKTGGERFISW